VKIITQGLFAGEGDCWYTGDSGGGSRIVEIDWDMKGSYHKGGGGVHSTGVQRKKSNE